MDSITNSVAMNLSKLQERVEDRDASHPAVHGLLRVGRNLVTEQQFFFKLVFPLGYHRLLSRIPCAIFANMLNQETGIPW